MRISEQITGVDAERLADCIKFASKQGLSIGEDTQCGVNQNSGNVWLWDEDWAGCVYCSIGFDVSVLWSCPNCGNEVDCETMDEAQALAESFSKDDHCDECKGEL